MQFKGALERQGRKKLAPREAIGSVVMLDATSVKITTFATAEAPSEICWPALVDLAAITDTIICTPTSHRNTCSPEDP